jgi:magnesium transporter
MIKMATETSRSGDSQKVGLDISLLRKALRSGSKSLAERMLRKLGPAQLAQLLLELPPAELKAVFGRLRSDPARLALIVQQIPDELLEEFIELLGNEQAALLLADIEPDDAKRVALCLHDERREELLSRMPEGPRDHIHRLLRYPPESAAGHMIPHFVAVSEEVSVGAAIKAVREAPANVPLFYLYVLDDRQKLIGVASLGQLVKAQDNTPIRDIMVVDLVSVPPDADQEAVARLVSRRNLLAVPVVQDGKLLGLVTIDDVIGVLEQEATEDMYNMAGLSEGDRVFSPPHRSLFKRLPWNMLNLGTSLVAASVVGLFETTIAKLVALATFMPVVASIGGNTGNQTLTVILRGITLGELEFSSALKALLKELLVGIAIGVVLGGLMALIAYVWKGNPMLGVVLAMAMVANLMIAALVGTAIPLTLKRLGLDPALGGSILVTMCTDVFGFLCFLGLATLFLHYLV